METFLIILAALAGGKLLKSHSFLRVTRIDCAADYNRYLCERELRFGDIRGQFSMRETLPHHKWKGPPVTPAPPAPPPQLPAAGDAAPDRAGKDDEIGDASTRGGEGARAAAVPAAPASAEYWHRKYTELLERYVRKDEELDELRYRVVAATKDPKRRPLRLALAPRSHTKHKHTHTHKQTHTHKHTHTHTHVHTRSLYFSLCVRVS